MFEHLKRTFLAFSKSEKIAFALSGVVALSSLVFLIGFWITQATRIAPAPGGEITEGIIGQPSYINPIIASSETDKAIVRLVFANLPSLAEKSEVSQDGKVWKVRLKEKLFWHDNEKLASDVVVFTIQKIQDPESQSPLFSAWQGVLATRLSELEIQFVLANPYAFFSNNLDDLFIVPKHLFDDVAPANWRLSEYNLKPIGSGPYTFEDYKARSDGFIESYRLSARADESELEPFIHRIVFRFFFF